MNDTTNGLHFEQDLRSVLHALAGSEAPASLRFRLADVTAAPSAPRLSWFASPPMRLAAAAVAVVAVLALAFLFVPRQNVGPLPTGSPTPSASGSATPEPSPSASASATPAPTPTPVPDWRTISWLTTERPPEAASWFVVTALLPWEDTYLGGGWIDTGSSSELAFFRLDGSQWRLLSSVRPPDGWSYEGTFLVPIPGGVLSVARLDAPPGSQPTYELRTSADAVTWQAVDDPAWDVDWMANRIRNLAAGPAGVVAIAASEATGGDGMVLHSPDGRSWARVALPATGALNVRDVTAYAGGFLVVGRDGEADTIDPTTGAWAPGTGRPAAWSSTDGVHWVTADVEGTALPGAELRRVIAGRAGFVATGVERGGAEDRSQIGPTVWTSVDGVTWRIVGQLGTELPPALLMAGDGDWMALVGKDPEQAAVAEANDSVDAATWISADGVDWVRLEDQGSPLPYYMVCPPESAGCGGGPHAVWVLPNGVAVAQAFAVPIDTVLIGSAAK
ncbi:MAG TPA: hypothetical protein VF013_03355 [Candidatus Limnocylindria bacterium]